MTKHERFLAKAAVAANVVLSAGAVASAALFVNFFYRYSWTGKRQFSAWRSMLLHYGGPIVAAGLLVAALRLKREYRTNLALVCVAVVLSVYTGELVLRLVEPPLRSSGLPIMLELRQSKDKRTLAATLERQFGVPIDPRNGPELIADLRAKGTDAVLAVLPHLVQQRDRGGVITAPPRILPLGGVSNTTTILCNESGQWVTYDSDEHGFRNAKRLWQSGHLDIVAVGDSFTQGYCAPAGKYFVDLVRQRYPATLNLGMSGNGPLLMLATLKEYVPPLAPKLVLWFYFEGNDLLDLRDERRSALLMRYLEDNFSQDLSRRQREADRRLTDFMNEKEARENESREALIRNRRGVIDRVITFVGLPRLRARLALLLEGSQNDRELASELSNLDLFRQILSRARATVGSWGGTLYVVYLPDTARFMPQYAFDRRLPEKHHQEILKMTTELGMPVIDVLAAFEAQRDPISLFPFRGPGHYAESGHRVVADEVLAAIARSGIVGLRGVIADAASPGSVSATWRGHGTPAPPPTLAVDEGRRVLGRRDRKGDMPLG
jgi:hypothetical protein